MSVEGSEVFSARFVCGNRTYFFDVKRRDDGSRYLSIREVTVRRSQEPIEARIIVRERDLLEFQNVLTKALAFLGLRTPGTRRTLEGIRQNYPQAYAPWTPEQDERVKVGFARGESAEELARALQRQPSAIRSRLGKLGLIRH